MSDAQRQDIALRELLDLLDYDYVVYSDNEYYQLSIEEEENLDRTYKQISKSGFVLYYKKRDK